MHTQNIFVSILRELKIPFTSSFASHAYEEHPYKYTFYGLKLLCKDFGIETKGLLVFNKENIRELPVPFVAEYKNEFHIIWKWHGRGWLEHRISYPEQIHERLWRGTYS